ncbi:MAG TPA: STAS domain-containing protein [Solirubrobacteraceae bacterium]|nr:STAS domain-containing protein [Solirubrobacteraceae bacterium]
MPTATPLFGFRSSGSATAQVVTCTGELDLAAADAAGTAFASAFDARPEEVLVDLTGLTFLDSTGVRLMLEAHRRATDAGVRLTILPGPEPVHAIFRICGLDHTLPFAVGTTEHAA